MDGKLYDSAGLSKVNSSAPEYFVGEEVGMITNTSSPTTGSIAASANSAVLLGPLTVTGDGVNQTELEFYCFGPYQSLGTANEHFNVDLWDGAVGGTRIQSIQCHVVALNKSVGGRTMVVQVPPFSGVKTFNVSISNGTGAAATFYLQSGATFPMTLRATRLRKSAIYAPPSVSLTAPLVAGAAQCINATDQLVSNWQTEQWDTHGMHNTTNPDRITIPTSGVYDVSVTMAWTAGVASAEDAYNYVLRYNSAGVLQATIYLGTYPWGVAASTSFGTTTSKVKCNAGDYLVAYIAQFTGATRTFLSTGCTFQASYIGPAVEVANRSGARAGRVVLTTTGTPTAYGAAATTPSLGSITVTGDGVSSLNLRAYISHAGNTAGGYLGLQLWENTVGTGINVSEFRYGYTALIGASLWSPLLVEGDYPPFTGTKTFHVAVHVGTAGNVSLHGGTSGRAEGFLVGTWV